MKHLFTAVLAVVALSGATFAGEGAACDKSKGDKATSNKASCDKASCDKASCDKASCDKAECGASCSDCSDCGAAKTKTTAKLTKAAPTIKVSDAVAKLEASSEKGCLTSAGKLVMLRRACGADDVADLKAKVAAYEKYGEKGCSVSNRMLARMEAALETPAKARLSERLPDYRAAALAPLFDASGVKDRETLVAYVRNLEAKGCGTCVKKINELDALLAKATPKLSVRVAKMADASRAGCDTSTATMKMLKAGCGADCSKSLVAEIAAWETKADKGCGECKDKLANVEMKLATATAKSSCGPKGSDCSDCSDCGEGCDKAASDTAACDKAACDTAKSDCGGCPDKKKAKMRVDG